jgi:hypothetical protein
MSPRSIAWCTHCSSGTGQPPWRALGHTAQAPAPPFVTRAAASVDTVARLRAGLFRAFEDRSLEAARADLLLAGIELLPLAAYDRIKGFERFAAQRGYPVLA